MKYPKEWPGFRVTSAMSDVAHVHIGGIVEAIGIDSVSWKDAEIVGEPRYVQSRIVSGHGLRTNAKSRFGYEACQIPDWCVEPLTPAAAEILAEVKAR